MIFRDVNPWAFLSSLSLPFPIPCSSERELNVKTRLRLFSLSRSLFPRSLWRSFIVKFALGYGFVSLTRRFFLNIFFPSVLGYRCYCVAAPSRFAFLARSGRDERAVQGEHLVEQFAPSGSFWSTDCNNDGSMECIWLKFLGNANATHRGPRRDSKARKLCQPLWNMQARNATRLIRRFTFLREATGSWYRKPKNIFIAGTHVRFLTWSMSSHWDWLKYLNTGIWNTHSRGSCQK